MEPRKQKVKTKVEGIKLNARKIETIKVEAVVLDRSRWKYDNFPCRFHVLDEGVVANKKNYKRDDSSKEKHKGDNKRHYQVTQNT